MDWIRQYFARRPLWQQLVLLALGTALPLLLSAYLMYARLATNERENIRQNLLLNARTLAALVDNEIDTHTAIATTLGQSPTLAKGDLSRFWQEATDSLRLVPGSWITLRSADGVALITTLEPLGAKLSDASPPRDVSEIFKDDTAKIGNLAMGRQSEKQRALVDVPVFQQGKPQYIVSISLVPERFLALIKDKYVSGEVVGILDGENKFVARVPAHAERLGTLASEGWRAAIKANPEGIVENRVLEGGWSVTGYAKTPDGWTVGVAELESSIQRPLRAILWSSLAISAILALISLVIATLISRNISSGMSAMSKAAHAMGEGNRITALSAPFAEANIVAQTLVEASAELDRRANSLAEANSNLEAKVVERTAELQAELERRMEAEATLRQSQKIETVGQLTGGIAHDFNNMLTVIMGNLDTVKRRVNKLKGADGLTGPIEAALQGTRNAAKLTHRLLAFARQQPLEPETISLNALISGMADMMARTVGEQIKIETVLGAGVWSVFADTNQLENTLANLIVNARDAMPSGGKLTVETSNTHFDEHYAGKFGDLKPGQYVLLSVTDEGTGIPADKLERIFEPFFTTKDVGKGTGLGLAMVHGFVKQSGGHIRVYSELGQGTTIKIYLPRHSERATINVIPEERKLPDSKEVPRARRGETVLVVEDDAGVRDYAVSVLEDLGYRVITAEDGTLGLAAFKSARRVDLLFTDVVLGGALNGRQLADAIKALVPKLPVLFTTGFSRNAIFHQGRLDADVELLNKPYTMLQLGRKVRAVIDG